MPDLQDACATILLARGGQPQVVQRPHGLSDVRLTLGVYAQVSVAMAMQAVATMSDAFGHRAARRSVS